VARELSVMAGDLRSQHLELRARAECQQRATQLVHDGDHFAQGRALHGRSLLEAGPDPARDAPHGWRLSWNTPLLRPSFHSA